MKKEKKDVPKGGQQKKNRRETDVLDGLGEGQTFSSGESTRKKKA